MHKKLLIKNTMSMENTSTINLSKIIKKLKEDFSSDDIKFFSFKVGKKLDACLIFVDSLSDKTALAKCVVKPLIALEFDGDAKKVKSAILSPELTEFTSETELYGEILSGNGVLIIDQSDKFYSVGLKKFEKRAVAEPPTSITLKGPREGFVEDLISNIALIRRRLKSKDLKVEYLSIGKYSQTQVALCFVDGVVRPKLKDKIKKKIQSISVDFIPDSSYIAKFLSEHKTAFFKQVGTTEKPDIFLSRVIEGRVGLLVDGSPFALTLPYLIIEDFQSADDYYSNGYKATAVRALRLLSVILAITLPAFFVSAELFHLQLLPLSFLLTIVSSVKGIPLSPSFEMFITLTIFEILNEASIRMPKYVGMAVSVVGGLVLGETAVSAGIISAPTLMIVAISGICLYTVPELVQTFSLLRILFLLSAGSVGGYGIVIIAVALLAYLVSFESYDTPLLAPFAPLITSDLKDGFYKGFIEELTTRPKSLHSPNKTRLKLSNGSKKGANGSAKDDHEEE